MIQQKGKNTIRVNDTKCVYFCIGREIEIN